MSRATLWLDEDDDHGAWYVRVPRFAASPLIAARRALRDRLGDDAPREAWMNLVRVPELDEDDGNGLGTIVYRERLDTDESVEVERARAELETARQAEHAAMVAFDRAGAVRRQANAALIAAIRNA